MNHFVDLLKKSKEFVKHAIGDKTIHVILGNESCDLDSVTCTLALAYLTQMKEPQHEVIPIMNVKTRHFSFRTEIAYLLKKYGIDSHSLIFRDEIDLPTLIQKNTKTSLVDHHVLSENDKILANTVVEIFDHRPINTKDICLSPKILIKTVGSCSTLIAQELLKVERILFDELLWLLYSTIIYDTIGLDQNCGRCFDEDLLIGEILESKLKIPKDGRKTLFNILWKIHNDTSTLTSGDLLYRDLKHVRGIPVPGLPMLTEEYLRRENSISAIDSFLLEFETKTLVLIGIDASGDVKRDIAIYSKDPEIRQILSNILMKTTELALVKIDFDNENIVCFRQMNIKLTRKFILPLISQL